MILKYLNPLSVFTALDNIDKCPPSFTGKREDGARVTLVILFSVVCSLLVLNYCKNSIVLEGFLRQLALWKGMEANQYVDAMNQYHWGELFRFAWWSSWHVVCYVLVPVLVIKFYFKTNPLDFGWRWSETHKHWGGYLYLLTPILLLVVYASHREDFIHHYPFYHQAGRSWADFIFWEALYLIQFACLEFFFRGYMVQTLRPYYGSAAIWIMIVPYTMIHFPKPWLEATGAIFFGLFLGMLALRSRSIWGGFFVHAGVAVGMDIASLIQQGKVPSSW